MSSPARELETVKQARKYGMASTSGPCFRCGKNTSYSPLVYHQKHGDEWLAKRMRRINFNTFEEAGGVHDMANENVVSRYVCKSCLAVYRVLKNEAEERWEAESELVQEGERRYHAQLQAEEWERSLDGNAIFWLPEGKVHLCWPEEVMASEGKEEMIGWLTITQRKFKRCVPPAGQESLSLPEGDILLKWPHPLSAESVKDLSSWLALFLRVLRRRTTKAKAAAS